jgi:hypothetical protein
MQVCENKVLKSPAIAHDKAGVIDSCDCVFGKYDWAWRDDCSDPPRGRRFEISVWQQPVSSD